MDELQPAYDVVVVGGGAAGLNGALMLARARRSVAVIDAGEPRNAPAAGVHGFLTRDGIDPRELTRLGRAEVRNYGGHVADGAVTDITGTAGAFVVSVDGGRTVSARRLLITTGLVDELPDIPGLREQWGRGVVHCPYCHGWEVRDQAIGVLGSGPFAVHQALLFRQWSADITLFLHTAPALTEAEAEQLAARNITVVTGQVVAVDTENDLLTGVTMADGTVVPREAVTVMSRVAVRADMLGSLGLRPVPHPRGVGDHIPADPTGLTSVPGVWAAGNVTEPMIQVGASAAAGAFAGAVINMDLVTADTEEAVARQRESAADPVTV